MKVPSIPRKVGVTSCVGGRGESVRGGRGKVISGALGVSDQARKWVPDTYTCHRYRPGPDRSCTGPSTSSSRILMASCLAEACEIPRRAARASRDVSESFFRPPAVHKRSTKSRRGFDGPAPFSISPARARTNVQNQGDLEALRKQVSLPPDFHSTGVNFQQPSHHDGEGGGASQAEATTCQEASSAR